MTKVNMLFDKGYVKITMKGHAGFAERNNLPEGHDIVCAAISILGQTLVPVSYTHLDVYKRQVSGPGRYLSL